MDFLVDPPIPERKPIGVHPEANSTRQLGKQEWLVNARAWKTTRPSNLERPLENPFFSAFHAFMVPDRETVVETGSQMILLNENETPDVKGNPQLKPSCLTSLVQEPTMDMSVKL